MVTIGKIQKDLKAFDVFARHSQDEKELQKKWSSLFKTPLSSQSAASFANYYRGMKSKSKKMRGGFAPLTGAPLSYSMTPGMTVGTYGRFPVEADMDPSTIRDLRVFYHDSLTDGCGKEDISPQIPKDMGSNQVGGKSRRKHRKGSKKSLRSLRRKGRKTYRKMRGGNLLESLIRPVIATAPPGPVLSALRDWNGATSPYPAPATPSVHTWQYKAGDLTGSINPGNVADISNQFTYLAKPAPWQTTN